MRMCLLSPPRSAMGSSQLQHLPRDSRRRHSKNKEKQHRQRGELNPILADPIFRVHHLGPSQRQWLRGAQQTQNQRTRESAEKEGLWMKTCSAPHVPAQPPCPTRPLPPLPYAQRKTIHRSLEWRTCCIGIIKAFHSCGLGWSPSVCAPIVPCCFYCHERDAGPVGLMDKASASGAGDSRFESWAGQMFLSVALLLVWIARRISRTAA